MFKFKKKKQNKDRNPPFYAMQILMDHEEMEKYIKRLNLAENEIPTLSQLFSIFKDEN